MMKRMTALLLVMVLTASFAACGKIDVLKRKNPTTETTQAITEVTPAAETKTEDYEITCALAEGETAKQAAFDGIGVNDEVNQGDKTYKVVVTVTYKPKSEEVFSILINSRIYDQFIEYGNDFMPAIAAKNGDKWLFSYKTHPDEDLAYYLYDAAANDLTPLGYFSTVEHLGNYMAMQKMVYAEQGCPDLNFFDWNGKLAGAIQQVFGFRALKGKLYLILEGEVTELASLSLMEFLKDKPDFQTTTECAMPDYGAYFSTENKDEIVLYPYSNDAETENLTCKIEETAAFFKTIEAKKEETKKNQLTESCDYFSVTLPEFWRGKYTCYKEGDSLWFCHTASRGNEKSGTLFYLFVTEKPEVGMPVGDSSYAVRKLFVGDTEYYIYVDPPQEEKPYKKAYKDEFMQMYEALDDIIESITPLKDNSRIERFDYLYLTEYSYEGIVNKNDSIMVDFQTAERNELTAKITHYNHKKAKNTYANATFIMYDNIGEGFWETKDERYGDCKIKIKKNKVYMSFSRWNDELGKREGTGWMEMTKIDGI